MGQKACAQALYSPSHQRLPGELLKAQICSYPRLTISKLFGIPVSCLLAYMIGWSMIFCKFTK